MTAEPRDEYEIIPTSPLRRLEKRIEKVETGSYSSEVRKLIEQIMELIKSNQRIIGDIVKANTELRDEMSRLPGKIDQLLSSMKEFISLLKTASEEETLSGASKDIVDPLLDKMVELVDQNKKGYEANQAILTTLGVIDKRLKRLHLQTAGSYRS